MRRGAGPTGGRCSRGPRTRWVAALLGLVATWGALGPAAGKSPKDPAASNGDRPPAADAGVGCPLEMARVGDTCIDRWEIVTVDDDTGERLSPYYPPAPSLVRFVHGYWSVEAGRMGDELARRLPIPPVPKVQRKGSFVPRAVSRPDAVPQGYLSFYTAQRACQNAGKRLCTEEEWVRACKGPGARRFPYGERYVTGACNVHRNQHPAFVLHGNSSIGHLDPRLNLLVEHEEGPLLRLTGESPRCSTTWNDRAVYDMVGNLDEWIDDEAGVFVGGFYARGTQQGCEARVASHAPAYFDYSLGTRCCRDAG